MQLTLSKRHRSKINKIKQKTNPPRKLDQQCHPNKQITTGEPRYSQRVSGYYSFKTIVLFIVNSDKSLFNQPILIVLISRMNPYLAKWFFDRVCVSHLVLSYYVSLCSEFHVVDVH